MPTISSMLKALKSDGVEKSEILNVWTRQSELSKRLVKKVSEVDFNGHNRGRESRITRYLLEKVDDSFWLKDDKETLDALEKALDEDVLLEKPLVIQNNVYSEINCTYCSKRLTFGFDGKKLVCLQDVCEHKDGLVSEFEINVPSGKLVVENDLRRWFPVDDDFDINTSYGCHQETAQAAKAGFAYGFVGNTCPGVYFDGDRFTIGTYSETLWDEKTGDELPNPEPCTWGKYLCYVCTDLWWYSICDWDELKRRVDHFPHEEKMEDFTCIDVKPGVYRFRHDHMVNHHDDNVAFATFEWVRDPDPVKDFLGEYTSRKTSALEFMIQHCLNWRGITTFTQLEEDDGDNEPKAWGELSQEQKIKAMASAADHAMCTLGGGVDWHENGFPLSSISEEAKEYAKEFEDIPPFDLPTYWYPISGGYGGLCRGAGVQGDYGSKRKLHLADDFVKLGLNICQNAILLSPDKPRLNDRVYPPRYGIEHSRKIMETFIQCYHGLRKNYPEIVFDKSFDAWMTRKGRYPAIGEKLTWNFEENKSCEAILLKESSFKEVGYSNLYTSKRSGIRPRTSVSLIRLDKYTQELLGCSDNEVWVLKTQLVARPPVSQWAKKFDFGPEHPPKDSWPPAPKTIKTGEYFEFDSSVLGGSHAGFCWHPRYMGGWASKENAQRFYLPQVRNDKTGSITKGSKQLKINHSGCGMRGTLDPTVPLKCVGRVVDGTGDNYKDRVLRVAFDYGTESMQEHHFVIDEKFIDAVHQFNDHDKYTRLLEAAKIRYEKDEKKIDALIKERR